jgi:hypothetical protein
MTGNIPKFMLAVESIAFDLLYLFQRFCLYPPTNNDIDHHLLDSPTSTTAIARRSDDDRAPLHISGQMNSQYNHRQHGHGHDRINDVF